MNDYYDRCGMKTVDFVESVMAYMESAGTFETYYEAWSFGNMLKYAMRAGIKPDVNWRDDARKCADYACRFKTGRFMAERRRELIAESSEGGACTD